VDHKYGAWDCYQFARDGDNNALTNADSLTFYALHVFLEVECGKGFSLPRGPQDN